MVGVPNVQRRAMLVVNFAHMETYLGHLQNVKDAKMVFIWNTIVLDFHHHQLARTPGKMEWGKPGKLKKHVLTVENKDIFLGFVDSA
jgi:hypothetical protein